MPNDILYLLGSLPYPTVTLAILPKLPISLLSFHPQKSLKGKKLLLNLSPKNDQENCRVTVNSGVIVAFWLP